MARVILRHVTKRYPGDVVAVQDADIEVGDREFMVLVGPSGCGKTTTLRMIAGLEEITEGEIVIGDRRVNRVPPKDRDIAMVFQNYAIYPHMTVYNNMAFGLKQRRVPRDEIRRRVAEAARILGIEDLLERRPKALSGGQRQRVAVGRAIVRDPAVFLFDEPLSNLDAKLRVEMRKELKLLHRRLKATIVYVTHDQTEAMTLGDRVCVMNAGRIEQIGAPIEVYDHPRTRFVAGFIGSPPMNFVPGELVRDEGGVVFRTQTWSCRFPARFAQALKGEPSRRVELGLRPEDLRPDPNAPEGASLPGEVSVVEALGNEQLVYVNIGAVNAGGVDTGAATLVVRGDAHLEARPGDRWRLAPRAERAHFFDLETGMNLGIEADA